MDRGWGLRVFRVDCEDVFRGLLCCYRKARLTAKLNCRDHRNYLCYMARLKREHGSVMEFVRDQRLKWTDLEAKGKAFEDPGVFFFSVSL